MCGHRPLCGGLALDHVAVEVGRSPHRLAGVVDDEVEPLPRGGQVGAERVDARGVAQVEPEHLEPVAPLAEVGLARVPGGAVAREASRDDQVRACAEQLDPGLVADLHATAGEESHASCEVGDLAALREVEVAALGAELVVERVHLDVVPLADITVLRLDHLAPLGLCPICLLLGALGRRLEVRGREDGLVSKHPQPGVGEDLLVARAPILFLSPPKSLGATPAGLEVGVVDLSGRREKPRPLLDRKCAQQPAVAHDRLERFDRLTQSGGLRARIDLLGICAGHLLLDGTAGKPPEHAGWLRVRALRRERRELIRQLRAGARLVERGLQLALGVESLERRVRR